MGPVGTLRAWKRNESRRPLPCLVHVGVRRPVHEGRVADSHRAAEARWSLSPLGHLAIARARARPNLATAAAMPANVSCATVAITRSTFVAQPSARAGGERAVSAAGSACSTLTGALAAAPRAKPTTPRARYKALHIFFGHFQGSVSRPGPARQRSAACGCPPRAAAEGRAPAVRRRDLAR